MGKHAFEKALKIDIPEDSWEPTGSEEDPTSRLLAALIVNGCYHHLEAYAVEYRDGTQEVVDPVFRSNFEGAYMVGEPDKSYQTIEIKGREYILAMTPYC